jgi:phosphoribosylformylglycinamidine synthase
MDYLVEIHVMLKPELADPQGQTVKEALHNLGYNNKIINIDDVRIGKRIEIRLKSKAKLETIKKNVISMCEKLLVNHVIEDYTYTIKSKP